MNENPLVSIICLAYNQEKFVKEALESIWFQTYRPLQVLIVDDKSEDNTGQIIQEFLDSLVHYKNLPEINYLFWQNIDNQGVCKTFNQALKQAKGKYIIDFSADDMLLDTRVEEQVEHLESLGEEYAVSFTNAILTDDKGRVLKYHYPVDKSGNAIKIPPQGKIYENILEKYFICTPTMMIRKKVLEELGGYNDELVYEDFDFWVGSSYKYLYAYLDSITTFKTIHKDSLSKKFYKTKQKKIHQSTLKVCEKAFLQNTKKSENNALAKRLAYQGRLALFTQNFEESLAFWNLLEKVGKLKFMDKFFYFLAKKQVPLFFLYKLYRKIKS